MSDLSFSQLEQNRPVRLEKDGQSICVARIGNEVFAISDTCTHSDASLSEGEITGTRIECWLHGAEFDLRTGTAVTLPAVEPVKSYTVHIVADSVTIEI
jgi:3-phenylpropionate/trans-cinnamate dioxygenase ferredoxin subunit